MPPLRALFTGSLLSFLAGCGPIPPIELDPGPPVRSLYVVPSAIDELAEGTFFDHPFPSDLRLEEGRVRVAGWPNPRTVPILDEYVDFLDRRLDGFSVVAAGFARFDGPLDPSSLPSSPEATLDPFASVQLVDVDPGSATPGARHPVMVTFRAEEGAYWPANTLAFLPVPGVPLLPHHRYALVVTRAARAADGGEVLPAPELDAVLSKTPRKEGDFAMHQSALAPAIDALEAAGIARSAIVQLAVFTTNDPTRELFDAAETLASRSEAPAPRDAEWAPGKELDLGVELLGVYGPTPNFQVGEPPYAAYGDGGDFAFDADGIPTVTGQFDVRFSLTVPRPEACPMPEAGYPLVLYAHGTGGDYRSYLADGTARALAKACLPSMGVDQIFHGTRPGAPSDPNQIGLLFFNFANVEAARTNGRQSAIDELSRVRLVREGNLVVPATVSPFGAEVRFDPERIVFFGHSQGSLNGTLLLASSGDVRGGVLSGASGHLQITLLEKEKPTPSVAELVKTVFLRLFAEEFDEVGLLYPPLALAQTLVDPVDPLVYAPYVVRNPRFGAAKSVYVTEGIAPDGRGDGYAPPRGAEALAAAMGLPRMAPGVHPPFDAPANGLEDITIPEDGLVGNLAEGAASGVLAQWDPAGGEGHFVVFDVPGARAQSTGFLRALADSPAGGVPAP